MSTRKENNLEVLEREVHDVAMLGESFRKGQVLTIIDACISDPEQRKGIKDLVHQAFYEPHYHWPTARTWMWEFAKAYAPKLLDGLDFNSFVSPSFIPRTPERVNWVPFGNVESTNPEIDAKIM